MRTSIQYGFIAKGLHPILGMAFTADIQGHTFFYVCWILGFHMEFSWPMADLATGIFERRSLLRAYKTTRLSVSGGMTGIARPDFFLGKPFFHLLHTGIRMALAGITLKGLKLFFVAWLADHRTCIPIHFLFLGLCREIKKERHENTPV